MSFQFNCKFCTGQESLFLDHKLSSPSGYLLWLWEWKDNSGKQRTVFDISYSKWREANSIFVNYGYSSTKWPPISNKNNLKESKHCCKASWHRAEHSPSFTCLDSQLHHSRPRRWAIHHTASWKGCTEWFRSDTQTAPACSAALPNEKKNIVLCLKCYFFLQIYTCSNRLSCNGSLKRNGKKNSG